MELEGKEGKANYVLVSDTGIINFGVLNFFIFGISIIQFQIHLTLILH